MKIEIFLIGNSRELKADAYTNYRILENLGVPVHSVQTSEMATRALKRKCIVVDAIFGVGLDRNIEGLFKSVIEQINRSQAFVISIDVPSGLDATTGQIYGVAIRSNVTVTFSFSKKGFYIGQGRSYVGDIIVVDIGIPKNLVA